MTGDTLSWLHRPRSIQRACRIGVERLLGPQSYVQPLAVVLMSVEPLDGAVRVVPRVHRHVATARSHRNGVNLSVWYWSGDLFSRDRFLSDCVGNHSRAD